MRSSLLHSSNIWLHPQAHIMRWPRSLKRAESSPAPMNTITAPASAAACNQRLQRIQSCCGRRQLPSSARLGRARAPVPTQDAESALNEIDDFISVTCSHMSRSANRRGCGHLDGYGIRYECDDGAKDHDDQADPNPRDQRIQVRFNDGASGGFVLAFIDQIDVGHQKQIFAEAGVNARQGLRLLAGLIEAALGIHGRNLLAAA